MYVYIYIYIYMMRVNFGGQHLGGDLCPPAAFEVDRTLIQINLDMAVVVRNRVTPKWVALVNGNMD